MVIKEDEYRPIMLHGWTHLPWELWPDYLNVDHLPWVFRDVVNYGPPREPTMRKTCVYVRQVHDELFLTVEHLRVHWLREREDPWLDMRSPTHPLQRVDCLPDRGGPRSIAARSNREFAIPNVYINIDDGVESAPICEDGPMRYRLAQRTRLPFVLSLVTEQHRENGTMVPERKRSYIAPIDPQTVEVRLPPSNLEVQSEIDEYCNGKRWDLILERAYLRDSSHCIPFTPDLSSLPVFFRETSYLEKSDDESYSLVTGQHAIDQAEREGLEMVLSLYRDTLRIDSTTLVRHNWLHDLRSRRDSNERHERQQLRSEKRGVIEGEELRLMITNAIKEPIHIDPE